MNSNTRTSAVGGGHSRKKPVEQIINCFSKPLPYLYFIFGLHERLLVCRRSLSLRSICSKHKNPTFSISFVNHFTGFRFGFSEPDESGPGPDLVRMTPALCSGAGRHKGQAAAVGYGRSGEIQVARYIP